MTQRQGSSLDRRATRPIAHRALAATRFRTTDRNGDGRVDARDLLPGDTVSVKVRLPPGAGAPPESIAPDRLIADVP